MESDTCRHVDEGFQFFAHVKIVTIVDIKRNLLERGSIQTVTDTQTQQIILFEGNTVDKYTCPTNILAEEETILIDEVVSNLFLLLLLCMQGADPANCGNAQRWGLYFSVPCSE